MELLLITFVVFPKLAARCNMLALLEQGKAWERILKHLWCPVLTPLNLLMFQFAISRLDCLFGSGAVKLCRETEGLGEVQSNTSPPVLLLAGSGSDGNLYQHRLRFNRSTFSVLRRLVPETVGLLFVGNCDRPFATMKVRKILIQPCYPLWNGMCNSYYTCFLNGLTSTSPSQTPLQHQQTFSLFTHTLTVKKKHYYSFHMHIFCSLYTSLCYVLCVDFTSSSTGLNFTNTESFNSCKWKNWFLLLSFFSTQKSFVFATLSGNWFMMGSDLSQTKLHCHALILRKSHAVSSKLLVFVRNVKTLFTHLAIISQSGDCAWR